MTVSEGVNFAGYRVGRVIGHGGMGVVHEATHLTLERRVALKLIGPALATDPVFRERFKRESRATASLHHPHVVTIHDAGEEDGQLYLVMEYVEGSDLAELLARRGALPQKEAVALIAPIADALDEAHRLGLVHRDIKPGNILIRQTEGSAWPLLTDFGLTRHVSSGAGLTDTGRWVGTVDYVAPEQVQGQEVDSRADVYSLGCVLFEALSGRVPFPADNDFAKLWSQVNDPAPRLDEVLPGSGAAITEVLLEVMAKAPDDRFDSAGAFAAEARRAVLGDGVGTTPADRRRAQTRTAPIPSTTGTTEAPNPTGGSVVGARPAAPRKRLGLLAAIVVFLGVGAGIAASSFPASEPAERLARGNISLSFTDPWQRFNGTEGVAGFEITEPIRLNDRDLAGAGILRAGRVTDPGPRLDPLPRALEARMIGSPRRQLIKIDGVEWWRYRAEVRKGEGRNSLTILMVESDEGYQGLACEGPSESDQEFQARCDAVAATLSLRGTEAVSPRPSKDLADVLSSVQRGLSRAERTARPGLQAESTGRQAAAAARLSRSYGNQARRVGQAPSQAGTEAPIGRLERALKKLAGGYSSLARAARSEDGNAYDEASRQIASASRQFRGAVESLGNIGYRFVR